MTSKNCPFEPGNRIWAYCRDSGGDDQQDSVASQRRAIEEYCNQNHLVLVQVFADEARPGTTIVGREGLAGAPWALQYFARQQPRPVKGIIFWSFSRLARRQIDAQSIKSDQRRLDYFVGENLLTPEFLTVQTAAIDGRIPKQERLLKDRVEDARRRLAGVEGSIAVLLDLAEEYGAASAGVRLVEREAERRTALAELEELELRQAAESPAEPLDTALPPGLNKAEYPILSASA